MAIIPIIFCFLQANGQKRTMNHLFKDKHKDISLYINPICQFSQFDKQNSLTPGVRAGVIIKKKISVGAMYNFNAGEISLPESQGGGKLQAKWGGFHLEYTLWPRKLIHLSIPFSAGIGQLKISGNANEILTGDPTFYFSEQGLMIEVNIWKYAKAGFGGSYRYTSHVSYNSLTAENLNGFAAVASVKLGIFNYLEFKKNKLPPQESEVKTKSPRVKKQKSRR